MKKILPENAILIPDNAESVYKGQIFDVYQWPQLMFDGTQATFELLKRPDTVQVIAIKDGKLVLVNDEQPGRSPRLHFAGGRVDDKDESWEGTAERETLEETGMRFNSWKLIAVFQPIPKIEWFVPWFLATDFDHQQKQNLDAGEKIEVKLVDFDEVSKMVLSGRESTLNYAMPIFAGLKKLDELLSMPKFLGIAINR